LQKLGTGTAHIQIIANHKAMIAHQPVADGTCIEGPGSFRNCPCQGIFPLPLIERVKYDPLSLGFRNHADLENRIGLLNQDSPHSAQVREK